MSTSEVDDLISALRSGNLTLNEVAVHPGPLLAPR